MSHQKKWLQRIRLVTILLVSEVLGVLMAPLPSDALTPTLTLKVDGGTPVSIVNTTSSTCTADEKNLGFTHCYAINTSLTVQGAGAPTNRSYLVRNAPNATARLRLADLAGQDKFSLIGVHFIPALADWNTSTVRDANAKEQHVLTIGMGATYDTAVNLNNAGLYVMGMRAGGELRAGPNPVTSPTACAGFTTTGACDTVGDVIDFPGLGTFTNTSSTVPILNPAGSTTNTVPLKLTVAGPTAAIVAFDGLTEKTLGQVNPSYPKFTCDDNGSTAGGNCKQSISQTMTVTLKGPDSFVLVNGGDRSCAKCDAALTTAEQNQIDNIINRLPRLKWAASQKPDQTQLANAIARYERFLDVATRTQDPMCPGGARVDLDFANWSLDDWMAFINDGAFFVEAAPSSTITLTKTTSQPTTAAFTFDITGPSPSTNMITESISMEGLASQSRIISVEQGSYSIIERPLTDWSVGTTSCGLVSVPLNGNASCTITNTHTPTPLTPSFTGLGDLPGGSLGSGAYDVSSNGSIVVGANSDSTGTGPTQWTISGGTVSALKLMPGDGIATAVSHDGAVIVGWRYDSNGQPHAFRRTSSGTVQDLETYPAPPTTMPYPFNASDAYGVSADGTVVVGSVQLVLPGGGSARQAYMWTPTGGMVPLGSFPSFAAAISADGSLIAGDVAIIGLVRWLAATGSQENLNVPPPIGERAISDDGMVIVGQNPSGAFRWSSPAVGTPGIIEYLPTLGGTSDAWAVSSDGSIIVGNSGATPVAVVWRKVSGVWTVSRLVDVLTNLGITDATGWNLRRALGISSDGRIIVGVGSNPNGWDEAWRIVLP